MAAASEPNGQQTLHDVFVVEGFDDPAVRKRTHGSSCRRLHVPDPDSLEPEPFCEPPNTDGTKGQSPDGWKVVEAERLLQFSWSLCRDCPWPADRYEEVSDGA